MRQDRQFLTLGVKLSVLHCWCLGKGKGQMNKSGDKAIKQPAWMEEGRDEQ